MLNYDGFLYDNFDKQVQHQANILVHILYDDDIVVLDGLHNGIARYQGEAICRF